MKINILNNKKILILGLGITSFESAMALSEYKKNITIVTKNLKDNIYTDKLKKEFYNIFSEEEVLEKNLEFDLILKSPGVPLNNKVLIKYEDKQVINDIELAYLYIKENDFKTKIIAITGTNGKTSTALFLEKFLRNSGYKVQAAGNIGISPLTVLEKMQNLDFLVLELSSFQLVNIEKFRPDYSFILNITPDHLDMHPSFDHYVEAKKRIYLNQTEEDYLFIKKKAYKNFLKYDNIKPKVLKNTVAKDIKEKISFYPYNGLNFNNVLLCYNLGEILEIDDKYFYKTLKDFKGIEHRVELVQSVGEITFYNDSKATTLQATKESLKHLENVILLVGGQSKGEDLSLFDTYLKNVKKVICYGSNKEEFISSKIITRVETLEEAIEIAKKEADKGDNILFSPASASFDQYENYKVRGMHFKRIIKEVWK